MGVRGRRSSRTGSKQEVRGRSSKVRMFGPNLDEERGAVAVEFAIIMIPLLIIVFGIVEFGIAFSKVNVYTGAAREGARFVAVRCAPSTPCTSGNLETRVINASAGYPIGPGTPTSTIDGSPGFSRLPLVHGVDGAHLTATKRA